MVFSTNISDYVMPSTQNHVVLMWYATSTQPPRLYIKGMLTSRVFLASGYCEFGQGDKNYKQ
jgi:hypothetical protein